MNSTEDRVYDLLPAIYRQRDADGRLLVDPRAHGHWRCGVAARCRRESIEAETAGR